MAVNEKTVLTVLIRDRALLLARIDAVVRDQHLAEDIFQDLSMLALDKRQELNDEQHLIHWLRQTARHRAIDTYRKQIRSPLTFSEQVQDLLDEQWQEVDSVHAQSMHDALHRCMKHLTPYARRVIELRYREGITGQQLADMLERSTNTVKVALTRIHRALANCIRTRMEQEDAR